MALLRSVATVGSYTLVSRLLGFVRDILTAAILGAGPVADAFFVAQRLPNLFRSLFAEGAFSAAFVPLASGALAEGGKPAVREFAEEAFAVLSTALLVFVLLGEIFMPAVMAVIAPGFSDDPGKFDLVVVMTRITFPYLLFISLTALQGGLLNAVDRFAAPAATPILLNLFLIAGLLAMAWFGWHDGYALAWALSAAGVAQFLWLMASCARAGVGLRLRLPRLTPRVRETLRIMAPGVFGAGVTQINLLVSTVLASLLPSGSISYLYYADRLNQLPLGVVGIAVSTAILPPLSRHVRAGDTAGAVETQNRGLELALLLTLPAAAALIVLAQPILAVLFERGAFGPTATAETAAALAAYASGLPAFVLSKVLAPGFYARRNTATPVKVAVAAMLLNLGLTVGLMQVWQHVGVAIALSASGWMQASALLILLRRHGHFRLDAQARGAVPRIALATAGMTGILVMLRFLLAPTLAGPGLLRLAALAGLIAAGLLSFAGLALAFGVSDVRRLRGQLRRRRQAA
ncbi:MAG TPA: murein biosynthesis integral membrane protein MurJ [Stellaceae bacterium]|jgi:putative peptidoglycan lipid II flippase|nr:murein biosynthesis integral membrane protein MurJ [Stellaceae bacterium]